MRGDSQHQQEEVQDWAAHLEHLQSILLEFDADCAPSEVQLCHIFYDGLRLSVKLWIGKEGWQKLSWDDLISAANRTEAKARIKDYRHLDQRCPKERRLLKLSIDFWDERPGKKLQLKATTLGLIVTPAKPSGSQRVESEAGEKARKK